MLLGENSAFEIDCQERIVFFAEALQIWVLLLYQPIHSIIELHNEKWSYSGKPTSKANNIVKISWSKQQNSFTQFKNPYLFKPDPNSLHSSHKKQDSQLLSTDFD